MTDQPNAEHIAHPLCVSPDGERVAQRIPAEVLATSSADRQHLTWFGWHFPDNQLSVELLSDEDVADWSPLAPLAEASAKEVLAALDDISVTAQVTGWPRELERKYLTHKLRERFVITRRAAGDYPPPEIDWTNVQLPPNSGGSSTHGDA